MHYQFKCVIRCADTVDQLLFTRMLPDFWLAVVDIRGSECGIEQSLKKCAENQMHYQFKGVIRCADTGDQLLFTRMLPEETIIIIIIII